jgi:hypothetical protein
MVKRYVPLLLLLFLLSACFLRKDFKASQVTFNSNGQSLTVPLIVPKGYTRQERTDTAGIALQTFYYPGGPVFYIAQLRDTSFQLQAINERLHQPRVGFLGGRVFKGIDKNELFYREIQQGNLRIGYRLVPKSSELLFDSATNYAALQRR